MRLRENEVYVKVTTARDVFDEGLLLGRIHESVRLFGGSLATWQELGARGQRPKSAEEGLAALEAMRGGGLQRTERFRFDGEADGRGVRRIEVHAMAHPYTGEHLCNMEWRWASADVNAGDGADRLAGFFLDAVKELRPLHAHAHDADDNAMQLVDNDNMLRLGWGVDASELGAGDRPGREISRGPWRLVANWLTWIGAEMREELGSEGDLPPHEEVAGGLFFRLAVRPADACTEEFRALQRSIRSALGFDDYAERTARNLGFWARRGNKAATD